ncbi:hypothetical protein J2R76_002542 [Bradyrhizobium sp. USDA 4532]|uniref:hypothetical protein n=1 Tax=unclassified Bradyrhizobium TaxID=2631580 RepID=UPI0020A0451C|nr:MULTISPECIES: hypothetical protein [unclassified Bradyrhizobium]MCP1834205.1 hypothetical protein [Bradyrhizobium sp. USDA 4545]MCP1918951.1 hypothetical protein [Bradyrhizobium sp. USDA 4532]
MTRFATAPQRVAVAIVLVAFIAALGLVLVAAAAPPLVDSIRSATPGNGDAKAYSDILGLMRRGAGYYYAAHEVLLAEGYGTASLFNWRTPAWPVLLALFPSVAWAQCLLMALTSAALYLAYRMIRKQDDNFLLATAAPLSILASLALLKADSSIFMTEIVAGLLILLSAVSYGNGRWMVGLVTAMAALFIRELAAPYILLCIAFAICQRNLREVVGWAVGLFAYSVYFAWHCIEVVQQLGPADRAYPGGWIRFGGIRFGLETAHFNGILFVLPLWLTAALLPAALTGLFAWRQGLRAALTVAAYLCIFAVVGKPYNYYWGALYTPLLMLGLPWAIPAAYDAFRPRPPSVPPRLPGASV